MKHSTQTSHLTKKQTVVVQQMLDTEKFNVALKKSINGNVVLESNKDKLCVVIGPDATTVFTTRKVVKNWLKTQPAVH